MIERNLGPGLAPDVGFLNGLVYVAWGSERVVDDVTIQDLQVHAFTPRGDPVGKLTLDGFLDSFPRITGAVLVYKAITQTAFPATAFRLDTGARVAFPPSADGNWPCVVVDQQTVAWQSTAAWNVWLGSLVTGNATPTALHGVGDGIESVGDGTLVLRKDIRLQDPAVGGYPSYAGDLTVGQYGYGIGVRLDGQAVRWIEGEERNSHPDPRCATDGTNYAVVCWGPSVRLYLGTREEVLALPLAPTDVPVPPDPIPPDPPDPIPPDPPKPEPPDPVPPQPPVGPYLPIREDIMTPEQGWLVGPGDKVVSVDAQGHVTFNNTELTDADLLELTQPDDRDQFRSVQQNLILGADATKFTPGGDVCKQFYAIAPDKRGNYESWFVGRWPSGLVTAIVPYDRQGADNGRQWSSASLTWVKK